MRLDQRSTLGFLLLLGALGVGMNVVPGGVPGGHSRQDSRAWPAGVPRPDHDLTPEDALPAGAQPVLETLRRSNAALRDVAASLTATENYVEDVLGPALERDVYAALRATVAGRAAPDTLPAALRAAAGDARDVEARLRDAGSRVAVVVNEIATLRRAPDLEGSVLRRHLDEMVAALSDSDPDALVSGAGTSIAAAADRAERLAAGLMQAAETPAATEEAALRELGGALRDVLDDLSGALTPQTRDLEVTWATLLDAEMIEYVFSIYTCGGAWVTIMGTMGDDTLDEPGEVTNGDDVINGLAGDDLIYGDPTLSAHVDGNDIICGGPGEDTIEGRGGNNKIYGGADDDVLSGGAGKNVVWGGPGDDNIHAGSGSDVAFGGAGNDQIFGDGLTGERDWLFGDQGDDLLWGRAGDDFLFGGEGSDSMRGGEGNDLMFGGPSDGNLWAAGLGAPGIETIGGPPEFAFQCGGPDWDYLWGDEGDDRMYGEGGSDWLMGGPGSDVLYGDSPSSGPGDDCLWGDEGADTLFGGGGADILLGGDGVDDMDGGDGDDKMFGEGANDYLNGQAGDDVVVGDYCILNSEFTPGQDTVIGGDGDDLLFGQEEDDNLDGSDGNDTCNGGPGVDAATNCETTIDVPPPEPD